MHAQSPDGWFEIDELTPTLLAIREPHHYEEPTSSLLIGTERAALIDTGCGIGDLRAVVADLTDLPVLVVNTHTHIDHLGGNPQFEHIAMFDHERSRRYATHGVTAEQRQTEILAEQLLTRPLPRVPDPADGSLPPFPVEHWLTDGDRVDLGGRDLEVIHTPGEAPDHVCLLDRISRVLFSGDILLDGDIWAQLDGASVAELVQSYRRLMTHFDEFDHIVPSHNRPWIDRDFLPESLALAESVLNGTADYEVIVDPWNQRLRKHRLGRVSLLTRDGEPVA
jgi:glyoxylase-like metal-dependent hydrolase (beta-lactamase superfamily II)